MPANTAADLIHLLSDYLRKAKLRKDYAANPKKVLKKYRVTLDGRIEDALIAALGTLNLKSNNKVSILGWGVPSRALLIRDFSPRKSEGPFTLSVMGSGFTQSSVIALASAHQPTSLTLVPTEYRTPKQLDANLNLSPGDYFVGVVESRQSPDVGDWVRGQPLVVRPARRPRATRR